MRGMHYGFIKALIFILLHYNGINREDEKIEVCECSINLL